MGVDAQTPIYIVVFSHRQIHINYSLPQDHTAVQQSVSRKSPVAIKILKTSATDCLGVFAITVDNNGIYPQFSLKP